MVRLGRVARKDTCGPVACPGDYPQSSPRAWLRQPIPMSRSVRILVVDDNQTLRVLLAHALEAAGHVAIGADSAEAAREVLTFDPPDLCVVDQQMPGMCGADLIRWMRQSGDERLRTMPCIGLTAYDSARNDLLQAGAVEVLQKPCPEAKLLERIAAALPPR
jgi:two-component system phosphate regulon response regulator PhoB